MKQRMKRILMLLSCAVLLMGTTTVYASSEESQVLEQSDTNENSEIENAVGIEVQVGIDLPYFDNVVFQGSTSDFYGLGEIRVLDANGETLYTEEFDIKKMYSDFDSNIVGKKVYEMEYKGFKTEFEINVRPVEFKLMGINNDGTYDTYIQVPIGGSVRNADVMQFVYDAERNEQGYGQGRGFDYDTIVGASIEELLDTSKAGIYEIPVSIKEVFGIASGTIKVKVGMTEQGSIDEILSSEAQNSLPADKVVGAWEVPSGERGAGTWIFDTGLSKDKGVTVWTFHDEQWLKIGEYWVDADGCVTVSFTAEQLSPVLITENDLTKPSDENNTENKNDTTIDANDAESKNDATTNNASNVLKTEAPKTGDNSIVILLLLVAGLSFAVVIADLLHRKKAYR